ncbi:MAG TPA: hypothetical protein VHX38_30855 [Pseudonocardiaceae bacterium]|nr:hypothetical protein [Pseudonocardiaceae bacterium]
MTTRDDDRTATGAARLLAILSVLPALLATAWLVVAVPLAATGEFRPFLVVPLFVLCALVVIPLGLAVIRRHPVIGPTPWWPVLAVLAIAVGFAVFTAVTHSQQVVLRRDAGSYVQIGYLIAHHFGVDESLPTLAFGPAPGATTFASAAFYQSGNAIVPQFMTGWPSMLAGADWVGGWTGMLVLPAVVGGCGILAIGGLAARLLGARWAPLAAFLTAFAWPMLRVAQVTLSEPIGILLLAAGICLVVDLLGTGQPALIRRHAVATGLVLSVGELVRLDFGVDFALVLPVIGWCWVTRRPGVLPFIAGAVLGGALAFADGAFVTRPYVDANRSSVILMLALLVCSSVLTAGVAILLRRFGPDPTRLRWWRPMPGLAAALVVLIGAALAIRPFVSTDHSNTDPGVIAFTENVQRNLGLPIDGTRGYAERSLQWVSWYLGWPLLGAALIAVAMLAWRLGRAREVRWLPVLAVYFGAAVLVLVRPAITPDHPWADRRLVTEVIPAMILFGTWTLAALLRLLRSRWRSAETRRSAVANRVLVGAGGLVLAVLVLGPMAIATIPLATARTEEGELAATAEVCGALRPNDSVVLVDGQWMPSIREQCGLPVALLTNPSVSAITQVERSIRAAGRIPVIAGSQLTDPATLHLAATTAVVLNTRTDQTELLRRPYTTDPLLLTFWLVRA